MVRGMPLDPEWTTPNDSNFYGEQVNSEEWKQRLAPNDLLTSSTDVASAPDDELTTWLIYYGDGKSYAVRAATVIYDIEDQAINFYSTYDDNDEDACNFVATFPFGAIIIIDANFGSRTSA